MGWSYYLTKHIILTKNKILDYFDKNGWKKKPKYISWKAIGKALDITSEAARSAWKRHRLNKKLESFEYECAVKSSDNANFPKILIFDLETAPLKAYVWRLWKQNVMPTNGQLQSEYFMLTYSAKWLFDENVISSKLTPLEVLNEDDARLTKELWHLLDDCDVLIAHNAIHFDVRMLNGRFFKLGLTPPSSYQIIDTLVHSRKQFNLPSHKLDYIANYLGLDGKIETNFKLWVNCLEGNADALAEMETYNIQDTALLEKVYLKMLPYIKPHPNIGLFIKSDTEVCPSCGSTNLTWKGQYATYANLYNECRCDDCGGISRARQATLKAKDKSHVIVSIPK